MTIAHAASVAAWQGLRCSLAAPTAMVIALQLIEIVIDLGRVPVARFLHGEAQLSDEAASHEFLETVVSQVSTHPVPGHRLGNHCLCRLSPALRRSLRNLGITI